MNRERLVLVIFLVGLIATFAACERSWREIGGKENSLSGNPHYQLATASVTATPHETNIASVAPRGAGPDGQAIFNTVCAVCHLQNGQGIPSAFPPLDKSIYVTGDNVERLASIMLYGLQGPIVVNGATYNSVMVPQGAALKDDELAAVATYIRSSWSNKAGPVEPPVFAAMRVKHGTRGLFTIAELGEEKS